MKKYMVYIDDGERCFKHAVVAKTEKAALKYCEGAGEVIAVKDITEEYPISLEKVKEALMFARFGETEMQLILETLENNDIAH